MQKKTPVTVEEAQAVVKNIIRELVYSKKSSRVQAADYDIAMADHIIERAIDTEGADAEQRTMIHIHEKDIFHDDSIGNWAATFLNKYSDGEKRLTALLSWRFMERLGVSLWILEHSPDLLEERIQSC